MALHVVTCGGCAVPPSTCSLSLQLRAMTSPTDSQGHRQKGEILPDVIIDHAGFRTREASVVERVVVQQGVPPTADRTFKHFDVRIPMTEEGAQKLEAYTATHTGEFVALLLGEEVLETPLIRDRSEGPIEFEVGAKMSASQLVEQLRAVDCE